MTETNRGAFILLEGFDGVGKTTLSKLIGSHFGYEYHKSPEGIFADARHHFDTAGIDLVDRLSYYSGVALRNSIVVEKLNLHGKSIVLDRYYHSLIAYHYDQYLDLPDSLKEIYSHFYQPSVTVCLELDFDTIKRRLEKRDGYRLDDNLFLNEEKCKIISEIYKTILPKNTIYVRNDTSIQETLEILVSTISEVMRL